MSIINRQDVWAPLHWLFINIVSLRGSLCLQFNQEAQGCCLSVEDTDSQEARDWCSRTHSSQMEDFIYENKECFKKLKNIQVNTLFQIKDIPFPALPIITYLKHR